MSTVSQAEIAAPVKVLQISSELAPFAKTGGLADVCGALPRYLAERGCDIRPFLPLYGSIDRESLTLETPPELASMAIHLGHHSYRVAIRTTLLPGTEVKVYLIDCPELYDREGIYGYEDEHRRFLMLGRAALEAAQRMAWAPDVIHCHDWHTGMVPVTLKTLYGWDRLFAKTKTVLTIHNIGYQGLFGTEILTDTGFGGAPERLHMEDFAAGKINFLKHGLLYADVITAVSKTYAREIMTDEFGSGLQQLLQARKASVMGIVNGVDYSTWSPESDPYLDDHYGADDLSGKRRIKLKMLEQLGIPGGLRVPTLGIVSRMTSQKGFDILFKPLTQLLAVADIRLVVLGSGDEKYERTFRAIARSFPHKCFFYSGYNEGLAHYIEAGSDIFLMPSRYEPCGLNQMYSLRYGTAPLVRRTGGLADTVEHYDPETGQGTGFVFDHFTAEGAGWALKEALSVWRSPEHWNALIQNAMAKDFSWEKQIEIYEQLYRHLVKTSTE